MAKKVFNKVSSGAKNIMDMNAKVNLGIAGIEGAKDIANNVSNNHTKKIEAKLKCREEIMKSLPTQEARDKFTKHEEEMADKSLKKTKMICVTIFGTTLVLGTGGLFYCVYKNKQNKKGQKINNFDCIEDSNICEIDLFEGMNDFDIN